MSISVIYYYESSWIHQSAEYNATFPFLGRYEVYEIDRHDGLIRRQKEFRADVLATERLGGQHSVLCCYNSECKFLLQY